MIKKLGLMSLATLMLLSSCITTVKTARIVDTSASIKNATVADLKVTDHRITYTMKPSKEIQRAGLSNVKQAAIQEALTQNGNADVMVEPEFVISMKNKFIFGKEVSSITVTGRPAYFQNFRTLHDSVWSEPGFYGQPKVVYVGDGKNYTIANNRKRGGFAGVIDALTGKRSSSDVDESSIRSGLGIRIEAIGGVQRLKEKNSNSHTDSKAYVGGLLTIGYNITPNIFVGVGSGYNHDFDIKYATIPIFGNVRYYLSPYKSGSLFVDLKLGGSSEVNESTIKGGLYVNPSIGYSFGNFDIAFTYTHNSYNFEEKYWSSSKIDLVNNRFGLSLGLSF